MYVKLKRQLYLGVALASFLIVALSILSYITSLKEREGDEWVTHSMLVKAQLQEISIELKDNTSNIRAFRRYEHADFAFKNANPQNVLHRVADLQHMIQDNPVQSRLAKHLQVNLEELFSFWNSFRVEDVLKNAAEEKSIYEQELRRLNDIYSLMNEMDGNENNLLEERRMKMRRMLALNDWMNIGGTIIILFVVIILCRIITREFSKRRAAETGLNEHIAKLAALNDATNKHNKILNGIQELVESAQKAGNVTNFLKITLEHALSFLNIPFGIAYNVDEQNELMLHPAADMGVDKKHVESKEISTLLASGKQADRGVAIVEHVPAHFWHSQSSLGTIQMGAIAYLFLNVHGRLVGVIELGSFVPFNEEQVEYLHTVANPIAVRLGGAQMQEARHKLLEQLQEQQEILINQQEELRLANDELIQQTHVLQTSEEELRVQEEELKQINVELEEKNEALEAAKEVLRLKAAELELSGRYKSEFLANMSHELRTPLNSILILAGLLGDNKDHNLSDRQVEYANIIHKSGSDLLKLINDILDLSKIEAGKVDLIVEPFALTSLAEDMNQLFFAVAAEKSIKFTTHVATEKPLVMHSDRQRLEQVIKNLLSNAFKFTSQNGTVSMDIEQTDASEVRIAVTDSGIGISPEKQEQIFEAFKQADGSTNRKYGGTGLGLSISKELVRILGGNIEVQSEEGKGSTFTVRLPLVYDAQHVNAFTAEAKVAGLEHIAPVMSKSLHRVSYDGSNKTILIIEDDINFASILRDLATERNYNTLLASNGEEGLSMAEQHRPDAIILDMQMPIMDGWEVLKQLKADSQLKKIPVHIISAMDDAQRPVQGSIAYLKKPVSKDSLENAFNLIGKKLQKSARHLLILSKELLSGPLLSTFTANMPEGVGYDIAYSVEESLQLGKEQTFDCILADIGDDIEAGIQDIKRLKDSDAFKNTFVILFINTEISQADEIKLKKVSEAIIMNSQEAQRRLADELELFLHKINETPQETFMNVASEVGTDVLQGKRILLADDDMRNVFALVSMLEDHQMEVVTASNGKEAIDMLSEGAPIDLVLMDIMMPEMDGYEAMQEIRGKLLMRSLPIIAITAKAMAEDRELCLAAGASDYISKPVDVPRLLSLMRVWLSQ